MACFAEIGRGLAGKVYDLVNEGVPRRICAHQFIETPIIYFFIGIYPIYRVY